MAKRDGNLLLQITVHCFPCKKLEIHSNAPTPLPSKLLKFAKPAFLQKTPPRIIFLCDFFWFCNRNYAWRARNYFFLRLFFQFAFTNKTNAPNENFSCIQMTHYRPGTTRNTSDVMCGTNLIFATVSHFALYFSIVRLQLFFFPIKSRLLGTNFIRTTYPELIRFSFLEVWTVPRRISKHTAKHQYPTFYPPAGVWPHIGTGSISSSDACNPAASGFTGYTSDSANDGYCSPASGDFPTDPRHLLVHSGRLGASTAKVRKTTVTRDPRAWTSPCLRATRNTKRHCTYRKPARTPHQAHHSQTWH